MEAHGTYLPNLTVQRVTAVWQFDMYWLSRLDAWSSTMHGHFFSLEFGKQTDACSKGAQPWWLDSCDHHIYQDTRDRSPVVAAAVSQRDRKFCPAPARLREEARGAGAMCGKVIGTTPPPLVCSVALACPDAAPPFSPVSKTSGFFQVTKYPAQEMNHNWLVQTSHAVLFPLAWH